MSKDEYLEKDARVSSTWILLFMLCHLLIQTLPEWRLFSKPAAGFLVWSVFGLSSFWIPPRPKVSYVKWVMIFEAAIIGWYLAFYTLSNFLSRWFDSPVALGISIFTFMLLMYWIFPLLRPQKQYSFVKWTLWSGIIAIIFSIFSVVLPEK